MSMITEIGRTRLLTRRDRLRRSVATGLGLGGALMVAWLGAAVAAWIDGRGFHFPTLGLQPPVTGGSGLLGLPRHGQPQQPSGPQFPLTLSWPAPAISTALIALPLWLCWVRLIVTPIMRGIRQDTRHRGLASVQSIRRALGIGTARRAGTFTLPTTPWWQRMLLPDSAFGFELGYPLRPNAPRLALWAAWEQRVRIIARTGWGKTTRLLVPIIRALPGPAIISSTEPAIFEQTVTTRQFRAPALRWRWVTRLLRRWLPTTQFPIAVVDFSHPDARWTAGYPSIEWNPIDDSADYPIAHRRAVALVSGVDDSNEERGGDIDTFFRDAATSVLAAWLHAADLGGFELDHIAAWLNDTRDSRPRRVLTDDRRADKAALQGLTQHLDPTAERTNSGVKRYLALALDSLTSEDGAQLCGRRFDDQGTRLQAIFDMRGFIAAGGTAYLLADPSRIDRARPLLDLLASEWYYAAEAAALQRRGRKRLPEPFIGIHDELRYGITVSNLPYAASSLRKYGIGYVYSVQSSSQEEAVYGQDAPALRDAAGVTITGGIDISSAQELVDRAGPTPVVTPTRGDHLSSEHVQDKDALTIADQQELRDGESVITARGVKPFLAFTPSIYDRRRTRRAIETEADAVTRTVAAAQARERSQRRAHDTADDSAATLAHPDEENR